MAHSAQPGYVVFDTFEHIRDIRTMCHINLLFTYLLFCILCMRKTLKKNCVVLAASGVTGDDTNERQNRKRNIITVLILCAKNQIKFIH